MPAGFYVLCLLIVGGLCLVIAISRRKADEWDVFYDRLERAESEEDALIVQRVEDFITGPELRWPQIDHPRPAKQIRQADAFRGDFA